MKYSIILIIKSAFHLCMVSNLLFCVYIAVANYSPLSHDVAMNILRVMTHDVAKRTIIMMSVVLLLVYILARHSCFTLVYM